MIEHKLIEKTESIGFACKLNERFSVKFKIREYLFQK